MRNKLVFFGLLVIMLGSGSMANSPAVIGGVSDGTALGLVLEGNSIRDFNFRVGFEANTSNSPGIVFGGGKWFLSDMNSRYPMFMSAGLVGYLGSTSDVGPYVSLIFNNFFNVSPLFLEFGIDVVRSGRLQLQLGYYF